MNSSDHQLRILLISQWPNVKNGEYELIEKIKQTQYSITVVDYFGFDVDTGECLNTATLSQQFDFAISFHYDTPKFLNIHTFLWVANPLEFMHLRNDYRSTLFHQIRAYDEYLYNGSETLKHHIRNVVGSEWRDSGLEMFPSCSVLELKPPRGEDELASETSRKVFYCGVNWERGSDRSGRAHGLLDILQTEEAADFFGPNTLEGIRPWEGFKSYKGEIPFDGLSMARVMRRYGAVLAVSSPAHMRSATSSSRVFEGISAGVPVISDENPHVKKLFGDSVYYFRGENEPEQAASIIEILRQINENPQDARHRVHQAQTLMAERYCFEPCFTRAQAWVGASVRVFPTLAGRRLDIFLMHHDAKPDAPEFIDDFANLAHIIEAAGQAVARHGVNVRVEVCVLQPNRLPKPSLLPHGVDLVVSSTVKLADKPWTSLRLGEKISLLAPRAAGDFVSFFTQFDFPNSDAFAKALDWFADTDKAKNGGVFVAGFFVNTLQSKAPQGTAGILRSNSSNATYRWTQQSLYEHQLASFMFGGAAFNLLAMDQVDRFDAVLPVGLLAAAETQGVSVYRSRHVLLRSRFQHFQRHRNVYLAAVDRGFWSQHYELVTNYNHELNALCDIHHGSPVAMAIIDHVSGFALSPLQQIDPAVHAVNNFIARLRPIYRVYKGVRKWLRLPVRKLVQS